MSLSKQQMLGAVGAGVFVLCAGGLGFMFYSAWSERGEAEEELQTQTDAYTRYNDAPVFPSKKSIDSVKSNETSYAAWYDSAVALAARGDRKLPAETPPIFKQRLQKEVRRMLALEGGVEGRIAQSTFLFGYEQYLGEGGVLPKDADVPRLAVQLDTITQVVDIFAEAGVLEVKNVVRVEPKAEEDEADAPRRPKAKKKGAEAEEEGPKVTCLAYAFEITTRPAALVEVLNRITACERFMTVKDLSFHETADMIVERIAAAESAETQKASTRAGGGRRGRRGATAVPAAGAESEGTGPKIDPLVVDPELDAPIQVSFTLEVRDFGRAPEPVVAAETAQAEEASAAEKPADKAAEPTQKKEEK